MNQTKDFHACSGLKREMGEPVDDKYREIKNILDNIRLSSEEERKQKEELLEKKKKELGNEKFQEWLFEQFGL